MSYRTILVHVDNGPRTPTRLDIGIRLARAFDAHLIGLHALSAPPLPAYAAVEAGDQMREFREKAAKELAASARADFDRIIGSAGLSTAEWRETRRDAADAAPVHARYADVVLAGQPGPAEASGVEPDFLERMLLTAGRPVLVVPYAGRFETVGTRALVAWNASREATRALTDSLPLLARAKEVQVVVFNPHGTPHGEVPGADIALYLARHGVKVNVSEERASDIDVGNLLLSRAADFDSDLLVMGCYGHSRWQELVMGGATRTVLESMTTPVLMSH